MVAKRFLLIVLGGIAFAGIQVAAFELLPKPWSYDVFGFLSFATVWATAAVVGGLVMPKARWSILAGPTCLLVCVWAFYLLYSVTSSTTGFPWWPAVYWSAAAVVLGPFLGAVGAVGRRTDAWSLVAWVGVAVAVVGDAAFQYSGSADYARPLLFAGIFAGALVIVGVGRLAMPSPGSREAKSIST